MRVTENYRPDELSRLCELNDTCFEGLERPPHEDFKSMLSISEHWFARAENDGLGPHEIVGYAIVSRTYGAYLWQVAVDRGYRRRGIAGQLLSRAEQFCESQGETSIRLHVSSDNPSQKLYFDKGYRTYDLARDYYGDGTLALMMRKTLRS